jgi:hypothetical protein
MLDLFFDLEDGGSMYLQNAGLLSADYTTLYPTIIIIIIIIIISGVGLSPIGTVATSGLLYKPQMIDEGDCGAIGGMKIGSGNQSTQRKTLYPKSQDSSDISF